MITLNGHKIYPTIFPDKTSQCWKIDKEFFYDGENTVRWEFENEAEFMHLAQLKILLDIGYGFKTTLELPYLPYARQDKAITNESTFALYPFALLLNSLGFVKVCVFDPHNTELTARLIDRVEITMPDVSLLLKKLKAEVVYPDLGAWGRYSTNGDKSLYFEKKREPLTGNITGFKVIGKVKHVNYLIQDDLADGGRTFIEVAKVLYQKGAKEVHLYVSHGIFSKGLQVLRDAGIKRIFTRKGEVL